MKWCNKGQHEVPREGFNKRSNSKDGLNSWCKACLKEYERERWQNGDNLRKLKNKKASMARARDYLWSILCKSKCIDCENNDPEVLQFDHLDPTTKLYNVCEMPMKGMSVKAIEAEMAKCVIRCANCHTKRTIKQFGFWKQNLDRV